ncbi:hypothetical protein C0J52_21979, partial [Blattella germanica]
AQREEVPKIRVSLPYAGPVSNKIGRLLSKHERVNEHQRYMRLGYPEKSAVAQHSYDTGHRIMFCETALVEKFSNTAIILSKMRSTLKSIRIILTGKKVFK